MKEPQGCCVYCSYTAERKGRNPITPIPVATQVVDTPNGQRDLCAAHVALENRPTSVKFRKKR